MRWKPLAALGERPDQLKGVTMPGEVVHPRRGFWRLVEACSKLKINGQLAWFLTNLNLPGAGALVIVN